MTYFNPRNDIKISKDIDATLDEELNKIRKQAIKSITRNTIVTNKSNTNKTHFQSSISKSNSKYKSLIDFHKSLHTSQSILGKSVDIDSKYSVDLIENMNKPKMEKGYGLGNDNMNVFSLTNLNDNDELMLNNNMDVCDSRLCLYAGNDSLSINEDSRNENYINNSESLVRFRNESSMDKSMNNLKGGSGSFKDLQEIRERIKRLKDKEKKRPRSANTT